MEKVINTSRVVAYCQSLGTCADLFAHFHYELRVTLYYPLGSPRLSDYRLFGMCHASTPQYNKDIILTGQSFPDGVVHVIFTTSALGMGIVLKGCEHYHPLRSSMT